MRSYPRVFADTRNHFCPVAHVVQVYHPVSVRQLASMLLVATSAEPRQLVVLFVGVTCASEISHGQYHVLYFVGFYSSEQ